VQWALIALLTLLGLWALQALVFTVHTYPVDTQSCCR